MISEIKAHPNARTLIITPRVEQCIAWWVHAYTDASAAMQQQPGVYVLSLKDARKKLYHMGAFDYLLVDDANNVTPIVRDKRYAEVCATLRKRNLAMKLLVYEAAPLLNLDSFRTPRWRCGVDKLYVLPGLALPSVGPGCGHENNLSHYYCRRCGSFRGTT